MSFPLKVDFRKAFPMADGSRVCMGFAAEFYILWVFRPGYASRISLVLGAPFPKLGLVITTFDEHGLAERVDQST